MSRDAILLEYATTYDWRDPDAPSVAVTADLLEEAVDYYIERMTEEERLQSLSEYVWEYMVDECEHNDEFGIVQEIVEKYLKDTT
jgi:hypothetical protein